MTQKYLTKLEDLAARGCLPHSWILSGNDYAAKQNLLLAFCDTLLNSELDLDVHPDFKIITPENSISIEDVRILKDFVVGKPQFSKYKIAIINNADRLTLAASNALLKILEEPGANKIIFLTVLNSSLLLPTIKSRCQILDFYTPEETDPQEVLQIIDDLQKLWNKDSVTICEVSAKWQKLWSNQVLYWLWKALASMLKKKYTDNLYSYISSESLWQKLSKTTKALRNYANGHNPNLQLVVEDIIEVTYGRCDIT